MSIASSLSQLFAYEHYLETAWSGILNANQVTAFAETTDALKTTPYTDVQLQNSSVFPDRERGQRFIHRDIAYFNLWQGTLVSTIYTTRGKNSDQQTNLIGTVRALGIPQSFTEQYLPYHSVAVIEEVGIHRAIDKAQVLDITQLSFLITFGIRPDAWP